MFRVKVWNETEQCWKLGQDILEQGVAEQLVRLLHLFDVRAELVDVIPYSPCLV